LSAGGGTVTECSRIAREMNDALLQSFQGWFFQEALIDLFASIRGWILHSANVNPFPSKKARIH
jgi:hypothetical protein